MNAIKSFVESFSGMEFSIPLWELVLLVVISSICLLLGKHKAGLLTSCFFMFYWVFIFNWAYFVDALGNATIGFFLYCVAGFVMAGIVITGFFIESDH